MIPTPYPELNQAVEELVSRLRSILGDNFIGAYLQGSFAIGDFDEHSDADFIVVLQEHLSSRQVDDLQVMHDEVYHLGPEWAKHLEGSYFPIDVLRNFDRRGEQLWYLDNGARSLIRSDHCNTLFVRWIVRERGVTLHGPSPETLLDPVPEDRLRQEMFDVLMTWGQQILDEPEDWDNRFYQGFIVLNYCRMLHDIHSGYPGSKREGAEWAKMNLDPSWSKLIDGAWDGRPDPARKVRTPADPEAYEMTLRFVEYVMEKSRQFMVNDSCA
jgi:predicted nucleotidyltransferase